MCRGLRAACVYLGQAHRLDPGLDLSEGIRLPLIRSAALKAIGLVDEISDTSGPVGVFLVELVGYVLIALLAFRQVEKRLAILRPPG